MRKSKKSLLKSYLISAITAFFLLTGIIFSTGLILNFCFASPDENESYPRISESSGSRGVFRSLFSSQSSKPSKMFRFEVKAGERMKDLMKKLVKMGFTTEESFRRSALMIDPPDLSFPLPWINKSGLQEDISRLEGLITPGVYLFSLKEFSTTEEVNRGSSKTFNYAYYILDELVKEGITRFEKINYNGWLKPYQEVILASIVQKEAVSSGEYGLIASVFYNRIKKGMPLASCPAVEYALGYHRPFLTFNDISIDSPYNLYILKGLPPTPICFFTDEALKAVQNPPSSSYYYFVYDWTCDKLLFSRSYKKHLENVKSARSNYSKKYGKNSLYRVYPDLFYENP